MISWSFRLIQLWNIFFFLKILHNGYVTNAELCLFNIANKVYTSLAGSYSSLHGVVPESYWGVNANAVFKEKSFVI